MKKFGLRSLTDPRREQFPKFMPDERTVELARVVTSIDYSYQYPPVDDQGPFGTCVAFGNKKMFEFFHKRRTGKELIISAKALWSELRNKFYPGDTQDDGAQVSDGLTILEQFYTLDSVLPYETQSFTNLLKPVPANLQLTDFKYTNFVSVQPNATALRQALLQHGPVVIGMNWANEFMEVNAKGQLPSAGLTVAGGHCVSVVGFDDNFVNLDGSKGAFHIVNNWSTEWADKGYCWLPFNVDQNFFPTDLFTVAV